MTGHDTPSGAVVTCALYEPGRQRPELLPLHRAVAAVRAKRDRFVWVGLHAPRAGRFQSVADAFDLHPLAVEDALHAHQRPKLERYGSTLFLVLKSAVVAQHDDILSDTEDDLVASGEVMVFMGEGFIVVVRHGPSSHLVGVRKRLGARPELLAHGAAAVLWALTSTLVDQYLEVAQWLAARVDQAEADTYTAERGRDIGRIYQLKRELLNLRRAVAPLEAPLRQLADPQMSGGDTAIAHALRDVLGRHTHATEQITALVHIVDATLSLALARTREQQNDGLRRISAIAAIIAVPVMVAGVYGMNFVHVPEHLWVFGYPLVIGATVLACSLIYRAFRRRHWL
ncbi:magnesium and cobalt transport protein CorA [Streptomyces sp. L-9-10]|uniref:magnesium and cobalt transport protein CorA n=1 Tax=Streptomyces sp. L-9-10 TaxID=1478131 RepID=UPI00101DF05C|nr:magnesium and cobalt transport protein CorA [Streptomyces sp. L-9-10]RYJ27480.1 magnesium and cobalt transport protein CorA [Streptomyces sp. L-9-10]